jgi:hypothetical protein
MCDLRMEDSPLGTLKASFKMQEQDGIVDALERVIEDNRK